MLESPLEVRGFFRSFRTPFPSLRRATFLSSIRVSLTNARASLSLFGPCFESFSRSLIRPTYPAPIAARFSGETGLHMHPPADRPALLPLARRLRERQLRLRRERLCATARKLFFSQSTQGFRGLWFFGPPSPQLHRGRLLFFTPSPPFRVNFRVLLAPFFPPSFLEWRCPTAISRSRPFPRQVPLTPVP